MDNNEKMFTQEDVNRIVQERLAKEKGKGTDELDKRAAELDARERKLNAISKLRENGLPDYLADALNNSSEEAFQASMDAIIKMKGETGADGGTEQQPQVIGKINTIGNVGSSGANEDALKDAFGLK